VRGGQVEPGPGSGPGGLLEVALRSVQRDGDLFLKVGHLALQVPDLVLGVADGFQELAVGPVPAAGVPVRTRRSRRAVSIRSLIVTRPSCQPRSGNWTLWRC
jgi:hypothetical protein